MSDNVYVFDDIFDEDFNEVILTELLLRSNWQIASDIVPEEYSDAGFSNVSYHIDPNHLSTQPNPNLNAWAFMIFHKIIKKSGLVGNTNVKRFLWSYYNKASEGSEHIDTEERNSYSVVYNITSNDGGTWIGDQFYESKAGRALLFPSWVPHRGVGPRKDRQRFILNIMFYHNEE